MTRRPVALLASVTTAVLSTAVLTMAAVLCRDGVCAIPGAPARILRVVMPDVWSTQLWTPADPVRLQIGQEVEVVLQPERSGAYMTDQPRLPWVRWFDPFATDGAVLRKVPNQVVALPVPIRGEPTVGTFRAMGPGVSAVLAYIECGILDDCLVFQLEVFVGWN